MSGEQERSEERGEERAQEQSEEPSEEQAEEPKPSWRGRLVRLLAILLISELTCYLILLLSTPLLSVPIVRVRTTYSQQSELIQQLLKTKDTRPVLIDPHLGWVLRPGPMKEGWHASEQGVRSERSYADKPPEKVLRVAAYGDSFVYGSEVETAEAWSVQLEKLRPDVEMLNYGVPGYGTDQALMRYQLNGRKMAPKLVIMGWAPTDMRRSVNVYRRFISTHDEVLATKPRYRLGEGDKLELIASPIRSDEDWKPFLDDPARTIELGAHDYYYEPLIYENPLYDWSATARLLATGWTRIHKRWIDDDRIYSTASEFNIESESFRLQVAILRQFAQKVRENGVKPVILLFPDRLAILGAMNGRDHASSVLFERIKDVVEIWDPTAAFAEAMTQQNLSEHFRPGRHYAPKGNEIMAQWLAKKLPQASER